MYRKNRNRPQGQLPYAPDNIVVTAVVSMGLLTVKINLSFKDAGAER
jgi:hypothetical protein